MYYDTGLTLEEVIHRIFHSHIPRWNALLNHNEMKQLSCYNAPVAQVVDAKLHDDYLHEMHTHGFNCVKVPMVMHLSTNNRLHLSRNMANGYHKFTVSTQPHEKILKATLYKTCYYPVDVTLQAEWIDQILQNNGLFYTINVPGPGGNMWAFSRQYHMYRLPVKTIENHAIVNNSFSFYEDPISLHDPFGTIEIEITFSGDVVAGAPVEKREIIADGYLLASRNRYRLHRQS